MKIGLVGLTGVGKTTLFNLLTSNKSGKESGKLEAVIGSAKVPDGRIDFLTQLYNPKKVTYPVIEFVDIPGLVKGASEGAGFGNQFLQGIRNVDLIVQLIRVFEDDDIPHIEGDINPVRDYHTVNTELLLADMGTIEKRIEKIKTSGKKLKPNEVTEIEVLEKCLLGLEEEKPIDELDLSDEERETIKNFYFLTQKPQIIVANVDEDKLKEGNFPGEKELNDLIDNPVITLSAKIEAELLELDSQDREIFMDEIGIKDSGIKKLALTAYKKLGLITFFTVGEDEVKGWTIKDGLAAKEAAGKIHSDIERGFIRAEVFRYDDLFKLGTTQKVREAGLFKLEGKEYRVLDGDIINFRFNV